MTREELKEHCEKQIEECENWAKYIGKEPSGKVYEEHKLILELLEQEPCEDAISRQAVLDMMQMRMGGKELYKAVYELPPVTPTQGWIPVSERLPKAGEYVGNVAKYYLVQNEFGDMMVARYRHSEYWQQMHQLKPIGDEIVAWMPLPPSYQGE